MFCRVLSLLLVLLAGVAAATAGVVIVQEAEQRDGPMPGRTTLTMKLSGERARMDMGKEISSIVDFKSGSITSLMHAQKLAMALPASAVEAARKAAEGKHDKPDLKPTGRKETISGFACEEYTGTIQGMDVSYWITRDLRSQEAVLRQMSALSGNANPFQGALADGGDFPGFPIRTTIKTPQMGTSTMTVLSVTETEVPESEFTVPADYQTMAAPAIPAPAR